MAGITALGATPLESLYEMLTDAALEGRAEDAERYAAEIDRRGRVSK